MISDLTQYENDAVPEQEFQHMEPGAFTHLYDQYAPAIMGYIFQIVGNKEIAETVLEKVYVKIWNKEGNYIIRGNGILGRLMQITRETTLEEIETNETLKPFPDNFVYLEQTAYPESAPIINHNMQQVVFDHIYNRGLNCEETASCLNITVDQVKVYFRLAIGNLKNENKC